MEGFSTPWSNKRTAGLPSYCSAPPSSLPLGLHQAPSPHQIHAPQGYPPLGPHRAPAPCRIHALPPPLRPCWDPALCGMTGSTFCWDPHPSSHEPNSSLDPHTTRIPTLWVPHPSGHARPQLHMEWPEACPTWITTHEALLETCSTRIPTPWNQARAWRETATSPSPPGNPPLGPNQASLLQACQITTPPSSYSSGHWRAPNLPKRHTQTGLDAKGVTSEQLRLQFYCSITGDFFPPL
jgi:hypothetical protein